MIDYQVNVAQTLNKNHQNRIMTEFEFNPSAFKKTSEAYATSQILRNLKGVTDYNDQVVSLTFDDGPDPQHTPRILDVLAEHKTQATFFVLGEAAERHPHLIERMANEGHTVANHTYSHCHPWTISSQRARAEVAQTTRVITQVTGKAPRWFRPPHGRLRKAMLDEACTQHMTTVLWNHSIIDWGLMGTKAGIIARLQEIEPGDIVLMHDGVRHNNRPDIIAQQLPLLMEYLAKRCIVPITLDQIL